MPRGLDRRWVAGAALVALALVLRLGVVGATLDYEPRTDDRDFDRHGLAIAQDGGYPPSIAAGDGGASAYRAPAYPYLVGAVYAVTGSPGERTRFAAARVVGAVLGAATVALIGLLALLLLGPAAALVAAGLAAVYPPLLVPSASLLSEALFLPLVLAAVLAVLMHRRAGQGLRWVIAAGVLAGLVTLTRPNGLLMVAPLVAALWLAPGPRAGRGREVAVLVACAALVIAPWTARNAVRFDAFVPVTTQSGYGLAGTYNETSRDAGAVPAGWRPAAFVPELAPVLRDPALDEREVSRELGARAREFIEDDPGYVGRVAYWNVRRALHLVPGPFAFERLVWADYDVGRGLSDASVVAFWLLAMAALAGVATGVARRVPWWVWAVPVLLIVPALFIATTMRYRLPADPFLLVVAAGAVVALAERRRAA